MKKILLLTLPLMVMCFASCEKDKGELSGDDVIQFKDPNFLKALLVVQEISLYDAETDDYIPYMMDVDKNKDGQISVNEAKEVKGLVLYDDENSDYFNISDVSEIKYFTSLTHLDFEANQVTTLDLSNNTALTYIDCMSNHLRSLNISKNTALRMLYCGDNQLTSLDLSNNTALTYLDCPVNQLISLDLSNNTGLTWLVFYSNPQLTTLDVSMCHGLERLDCVNYGFDGDYDYNTKCPLESLKVYKYHSIINFNVVEEAYGDIIEYVE